MIVKLGQTEIVIRPPFAKIRPIRGDSRSEAALQIRRVIFRNASRERDTREEAERRCGYNARFARYAAIVFRLACVQNGSLADWDEPYRRVSPDDKVQGICRGERAANQTRNCNQAGLLPQAKHEKQAESLIFL